MTLNEIGRDEFLRRSATMSVSRRRLYGWVITFWLWAMVLIGWADKGVIGLTAVPIMRDLHLAPGQFGLASSGVFFLFGISTVAVGFIADRFRTRGLLAVLVVLWSVAQVPVLLVAALPALLSSRILLGAAEGPTTPIHVHAIAKWFPDRERSLPVGLSNTGGSLGLAIAAPILTFFTVNYGWRSAFLVLAVAGVVWAIVWLVIGRDGPFSHLSDTTSHETAGTGVAEHAGERRVPYSKLLLSGTWIGVVLAGFVSFWAISIMASWLPAYLQKVLHYSPTAAGNLVALPPLLGAVAVVIVTGASGWSLRRGVPTRWARAVLAGGIILCAGVCMLLLSLLSPGAHLVGLMVVAFGLPVTMLPLVVLMLAEMAPERQRGAILSFSGAGVTLAGVIAPAVSGALIGGAGSPSAGYDHVFLFAAVLMMAGGVLCAILAHPQRDARRFGLATGQGQASSAATSTVSETE